MAVTSPGALRRMQDIASQLWRSGCRWTAGELAWAFLTDPGEQEVRFFDEGWAWLRDDRAVIVASAPGAVAGVIANWTPGLVQVTDGDEVLRSALDKQGYREVVNAPYDLDMRLAAASAPLPVLPASYLVHSAGDGDDLLGVHRAAWRPADLPFAPGCAPPFDPQATSSLTAPVLAAVQSTWPYRRDLHIVAEAPDGSLAASCIAWLDPVTGVAAIEPLGVRPGHRRQGLAGALCLHAAQLIRSAGGDELVIHPRGDAAYPAPRAAYQRCGFAVVGRTYTYARSSDP
jgi:GNAT superfamily N-acetyltransferase